MCIYLYLYPCPTLISFRIDEAAAVERAKREVAARYEAKLVSDDHMYVFFVKSG